MIFWRVTGVLGIAILAAGCGDRGGAGVSTTVPATCDEKTREVVVLEPEPQPEYAWYEIWPGEGEAEKVMVTRLTIPGVIEDDKNSHLLKRYVRENDGAIELPPKMYMPFANMDGFNKKGGLESYCGGGISVDWSEGDETKIVLEISYYWVTREKVSGKLDEKVTLKVGEPADVKLPNGARLKVEWPAK